MQEYRANDFHIVFVCNNTVQTIFIHFSFATTPCKRFSPIFRLQQHHANDFHSFFVCRNTVQTIFIHFLFAAIPCKRISHHFSFAAIWCKRKSYLFSKRIYILLLEPVNAVQKRHKFTNTSKTNNCEVKILHLVNAFSCFYPLATNVTFA